MSDKVGSLIYEFDSLIKDYQALASLPTKIVPAFVEVLKNYELIRIRWKESNEETQSLSLKLQDAQKEIASLEKQVQHARRLLDEEKSKRQLVIEERNYAETQLDLVRDVLRDNRNKLHDDTKEKLYFLNKSRQSAGDICDRLDTIAELESTGSVMSELSYTRDEDDFLEDIENHRPSKRSYPHTITHHTKRRRSTKTIEFNGQDKVVATTTLTLDHQGPLSATSIIETIPNTQHTYQVTPSAPPLMDDSGDSDNEFHLAPTSTLPFSMNTINTRPHNFVHKAMIKGEVCNVCSKRLRFSAMGVKCRECKAVAHSHCEEKVPLPCVPVGSTPNSKSSTMGTIADYTPHSPPMIPSLVIHCIKEIESRGLKEVGLYRIPGADKEVKMLKEKFLKGRGIPNLSQVVDIHTICGCLKEFLRTLKEPLVTKIRWNEFTRAVDINDAEKRRCRFMQIISELPQPNRDTLSCLILHLKKVAEVPECKMPVSNLAKVFGPTIIGYSRSDPENVFAETSASNQVMNELLCLPTDFWEKFIRDSEYIQPVDSGLPKTPSSNSLLNFFGNTPSRSKSHKKFKYFDTP